MNAASPASLALRAVEATIDRHEVLRNIDLQILPGELFVLLGGTGAGKSTLLRVIAGLERVARGDVVLDDHDITRTASHRRQTALLAQRYPLWPDMTIADNVAFALRGRGLRRAEIRQHTLDALRSVGLADFARHLPSQLTPSQCQRVAFARTLAAQARLYLLDEPFGALEPALRTRLARLFRQRQQQAGFTTLLATQDHDVALRIADRIAVIHDGELHQVGTPTELYDRPETRHVAAYTGSVNLIDGEIELDAGQAMFHAHNGLIIPLFDDAVRRSRSCAAMFRPHHLHLVAAEQAPAANQIRFRGRVTEREFLGDRFRYRLDVGDSTAWIDVGRRQDRMPLHVGDQITLGLDPADVRLLDH